MWNCEGKGNEEGTIEASSRARYVLKVSISHPTPPQQIGVIWRHGLLMSCPFPYIFLHLFKSLNFLTLCFSTVPFCLLGLLSISTFPPPCLCFPLLLHLPFFPCAPLSHCLFPLSFLHSPRRFIPQMNQTVKTLTQRQAWRFVHIYLRLVRQTFWCSDGTLRRVSDAFHFS